VQDVGEDLSEVSQGRVPVGGAKVSVPAETKLRAGEAIRGVERRPELGALGADPAKVGRRRLDAANTCDLPPPGPLPLQAKATADPAVGADRLAEDLQAAPPFS